MTAQPAQPAQPSLLAPPAIVAPAEREVSFGRIAGVARPGTRRVVVSVGGRVRAAKAVQAGRFAFYLSLPRRDVTVRVIAFDGEGNRAAATVGPVYGLPRSAAPGGAAAYEDPLLARKVRALARSFPGTSAVYVQDLRSGAGASWNARARFPAASTLKLAIAVEVLRVLQGKPAPGSRLDRLLHDMLVDSDNEAANELEIWLGGSTSGGSAKVNATMRALGLHDTEMFGGYARTPASARDPIPLHVESQPSFGLGKYTTASDLARLLLDLHLAAGGQGPLVHRLRGAFTPADARFLLFMLAHAGVGTLGPQLGGSVAVLHKAGWIERARHDAALVYWPGGVFVATVMTWNPAGVGASAEALAGRVARATLEHLRRGQRANQESP